MSLNPIIHPSKEGRNFVLFNGGDRGDLMINHLVAWGGPFFRRKMHKTSPRPPFTLTMPASLVTIKTLCLPGANILPCTRGSLGSAILLSFTVIGVILLSFNVIGGHFAIV